LEKSSISDGKSVLEGARQVKHEKNKSMFSKNNTNTQRDYYIEKRENIYTGSEYLLISSVGSKIQTTKAYEHPKIYEQTQKHAINQELVRIFLPCYFLLNGFYLKSLLFIFE